MNQTWKDIEGKEHKVEDAHKHNQLLIIYSRPIKRIFRQLYKKKCSKKGNKYK